MKAAVVTEWGKAPVYQDFDEPVAGAGEVRIEVHAAALSNVVRSRASGRHYSTSGRLPFVVGVDGVGRVDDGRRVYFLLPRAPYGTLSERTVIPQTQLVPLPDNLDDVTAAAVANPGLSSWAALKERAKFVPGETVLVNGATGTAGRLAVQIAKRLGARRVLATGRNAEALKEVGALGADVTIPIGDAGEDFEEALKSQFGGEGIDVVLDYLWGPSSERIIAAGARAGKDAVPIRFVHIGSVSAPNITLPSAALRSSAIVLLGSGIGSLSMDRVVACVAELMEATVPGGFQIATRTVPLADIEHVWSDASNSPRIVVKIP